MEQMPNFLRMLPAIVVLILLIAIIAFYIRSNIQQARKDDQLQEKAQEFEERMARAVWAGASIVHLKSQEILADATGTVKAELSLLIQPPDGEAYTASTIWRVDIAALASVQPGQSVSVKIDQHDPQVIYPNVSWARYWIWH